MLEFGARNWKIQQLDDTPCFLVILRHAQLIFKKIRPRRCSISQKLWLRDVTAFVEIMARMASLMARTHL
ncbi:hypothetical protein [Kamptonema formosum]|uniref:hypothetical protein n=1 Tax=Kamptonema formosum TaxID=331992 RepID=UPI00034622FA|nr:hypothetical protein [Oscillatoria sp. PCC 10802]